MRLVVVDVGNTSTAVGLWSDGRVSHVAHCDDGFEGASRVVRELVGGGAPGVCALPMGYVSVVPKVDRKWRALAKELGVTFHQVTCDDFGATRKKPPAAVNLKPQPQPFITLDYPQPETIGADRLADAVGAVSQYGAPVLVMDFGTALTAAVVTADRVWRGGVIAPGFPLMRDYLFERTAKLPRMELGTGKAPKIGRSTEEAMRFGALVGYRGMVREIVAELTKNFKTNFKLVATGGFAKWALKSLDLPFVIDPTLTLYGTGLIAAGGKV